MTRFKILVLAVLLATALFFLGKALWPSKKAANPFDDIPIANQVEEEENELIGSTGNAREKEVLIWRYSPDKQSFEPTERTMLIWIRPTDINEISYRFEGDALALYSPKPKELQEKEILYLEGEKEGETTLHLEMDGKRYPLDRSHTQRWPLLETDEDQPFQ